MPRSEVKRQGGKITTTRWIDADKGFRGKPNYRSRFVARDIKRDKRMDLFSATPPLETLRLFVAGCAKRLHRKGADEDGGVRREQGVLLCQVDPEVVH